MRARVALHRHRTGIVSGVRGVCSARATALAAGRKGAAERAGGGAVAPCRADHAVMPLPAQRACRGRRQPRPAVDRTDVSGGDGVERLPGRPSRRGALACCSRPAERRVPPGGDVCVLLLPPPMGRLAPAQPGADLPWPSLCRVSGALCLGAVNCRW